MLNAGRRTSLARLFRAALGSQGRLIVADADPLAPAFFESDAVLRPPRIDEGDYVEFVRKAISDHNIDLYFSCIDTDQIILSEHESQFGGRFLGSTLALNRIAFDKWETFVFFSAHGVATPRSWLPGSNDLPEELFIKPRMGSASIGARPASRDEIEFALFGIESPIIQERMIGQELTIDVLFDFQGRLLHYVPRARVRHLAGESIQGVTVDDEPFRDWLNATLEAIGRGGGRGPITLQAFLTESGPFATEINPRFSGGFPLSYEAGSRQPDWCIQMAAGSPVAAQVGEYERGLYMTRSYREYFTRDPRWS